MTLSARQPRKNLFSPRPGLAGGILIYGVGDLANRSLASLLLIPLYTHYLSVGDYGIITTLTPVAWLLITICGMSLPGALVRFYHDHTDMIYRRRLFSTVLAYLMIAPLVPLSLLLVAGPRLFGRIFPQIPFSPYGVLLVWFVYFALIPQILLALWRTEEKPFQYALLSCGGFFATACGITFMIVALQRGVYGKMLAELVVAALWAFLSLALMRRLFTRRLDFRLLQSLLLYSAPMVPHLIARWLLSYVSRIQLLAETDLEQAGLFGLGSQIGGLAIVVSSSVMRAVAPWFYRTAPKEGSAEVFSRVSTLFFAAFISLTTFICIFAKEILLVLSAQEFAAAYPVVLLCALGALFLSAYNFPMLGLMYLKKTYLVPILTVTSASILLGANHILIPRLGIVGAAIGTAIGQGVLFVCAFSASQRLYPIRYEYAKIARLTGVFAAVYAVTYILPPASMSIAIGMKVLIVATVPIWLRVLGIVNREEMASFVHFVVGVLRRLRP